MSDQVQTTQRLRGPNHLLAGRFRRRMERLSVLVAVLPVVVPILVAVVLAFMSPWLFVLAVASGAGLLVWLPSSRSMVARSYWRSRWFWDARSAGLSLEAEPSMLGRSDGPLDRLVVVVPRVRLTVDLGGTRRYRCKALPGQTAADYEAALGRLAMRWGAGNVRMEHVPGARWIALVVDPSTPARTVWAAPEGGD